jgi:hypothetical protein
MIRERENEDMQVTEQEFRRACDMVIAFTDQPEHLSVKEFRRACDSVVAFTDQHEHLTNQQQRLLFTVVQSLANTLGASMKPRVPLPTFP